MKISISTPFAGKSYCFDEYSKSVEAMLKANPDITFHYVVYDNSNDKDFSDKLKAWVNTLGISFTYYEDKLPKHTIENTSDYAIVSKRIADIMKVIFERLVKECDYVLNIEDDMSFEPDALSRLLKCMDNPEVATAIGSSYGRRLGDRGYGVPCIWRFEGTWGYPQNIAIPKVSCIRLPERPFGIEIVGSGHIALWLTRYEVLKKLGWEFEEDGVSAGDICWGYRLYKAGYYMVVDWSIHTKHWSNVGGEVDYFTYGHTKGNAMPSNVVFAPKTKG